MKVVGQERQCLKLVIPWLLWQSMWDKHSGQLSSYVVQWNCKLTLTLKYQWSYIVYCHMILVNYMYLRILAKLHISLSYDYIDSLCSHISLSCNKFFCISWFHSYLECLEEKIFAILLASSAVGSCLLLVGPLAKRDWATFWLSLFFISAAAWLFSSLRWGSIIFKMKKIH